MRHSRTRPAGLQRSTRRKIHELFRRLHYGRLATIYCDEGGVAFWRARRGSCERLGVRLARVLRDRLVPGGRSLYVGAGVAELPMMVMERMELDRRVTAYNLRNAEARVLNAACRTVGAPLVVQSRNARSASGRFDHVWIVSVLNDPERYPELASLSYGRANPVTFDPRKFSRERAEVARLADACLKKVRLPGLVSTSVEEIPWITSWCERERVRYVVEEEDYPTAIVEDPLCFIRLLP